jgi:hypothetical protein
MRTLFLVCAAVIGLSASAVAQDPDPWAGYDTAQTVRIWGWIRSAVLEGMDVVVSLEVPTDNADQKTEMWHVVVPGPNKELLTDTFAVGKEVGFDARPHKVTPLRVRATAIRTKATVDPEILKAIPSSRTVG